MKAERSRVSASFRPMRAALERAGAGAEPRAVVRGSETLAARLVGGGYLALLAACVFAGDASDDDSLLWVGGAALVLALGTLTAGLAGAVALPRLSGSALWCLALTSALVAWLGVSIAWSVEPDRSWSYFDRGVVYLALLGVGILAGGLVRRAATVAAAELALVVGVVLAVGLAVKVFPSLYPDSERIARLRAPVGYWNTLALLFAFGLPLTLWLAGLAGRRTGLRALAVVFAYLLGVGLALTFSRGGILAALAALVVALALNRDRVHTARGHCSRRNRGGPRGRLGAATARVGGRSPPTLRAALPTATSWRWRSSSAVSPSPGSRSSSPDSVSPTDSLASHAGGRSGLRSSLRSSLPWRWRRATPVRASTSSGTRPPSTSRRKAAASPASARTTAGPGGRKPGSSSKTIPSSV